MSKGMCWSHAATLRQHIQMSRPFNFPLGIAENILGVSGDRGKAEDGQIGHSV